MYDGLVANVMLGITEQYLIPFAIALRASNQAIGLLNACKSLTAAACQLWSGWLTERFQSRRRFILFGVFWQAAAWIPMALIPLAVPGSWRVPSCIVLASVSALFGSWIGPTWSSLMADHIPERFRGRYFGWRNQILGFVNLMSVFGAGLLLHFAGPHEALGFAILFLISAATRFISWYYLSLMYEPPLAPVTPEERISIWQILLDFRAGNAFTRFLLFVGGFLFAVYLGSPFITVYLLKELRYSYFQFTIVVLTAQLSSFVMMRYWGRRADRFGNIKVLKACSIGVIIVPFLWLAPPSLPYFLAIQILAGMVWSGFNLTVANFAFDASMPEHRTDHVASVNIMNGLGTFLGSLAGGWIATRAPVWHGRHIPFVLLVSGLARLVVGLACLGRLKEVRRVKHISTIDVVTEPGLRLLNLMLRPFS